MCTRSGPKRYDWTGACWMYTRDGVTLHQLLSKEFSAIFKLNMDLSTLLHSWQFLVSGLTFCRSPISPQKHVYTGYQKMQLHHFGGHTWYFRTKNVIGPEISVMYGLLWLVPTVALMARLWWLVEVKYVRIWGEYAKNKNGKCTVNISVFSDQIFIKLFCRTCRGWMREVEYFQFSYNRIRNMSISFVSVKVAHFESLDL